jgi:hypothetical protein
MGLTRSTRINRTIRIATLLGCLAATACVGQAEAQPYAYQPIPPPRFEPPPPPPPPGPRLVWQAGGWDWTGRNYAWIPGHYVAWQPHAEHWIGGHWAYRGRQPFWVPAHWG